ncbi:hypothetical protein CEXT_599431 [Caerostris extrusa]|uniref:Uncharacterized protein n=1 Tax=Caerostris extrusa TaxID=172846 RepID=A0AAV4P4S1_CAEEX|nr:hypothetical protein CEXT_599431 [Caerostris extrusa]
MPETEVEFPTNTKISRHTPASSKVQSSSEAAFQCFTISTKQSRTDRINTIKSDEKTQDVQLKILQILLGNISSTINSSIPAERFNKLRGIFPVRGRARSPFPGDNKRRFKEWTNVGQMTGTPSSRHNLIRGNDRGKRVTGQICVLLLSVRLHKYRHYLALKGGANGSFSCESGVSELFMFVPYPHASLVP